MKGSTCTRSRRLLEAYWDDGIRRVSTQQHFKSGPSGKGNSLKFGFPEAATTGSLAKHRWQLALHLPIISNSFKITAHKNRSLTAGFLGICSVSREVLPQRLSSSSSSSRKGTQKDTRPAAGREFRGVSSSQQASQTVARLLRPEPIQFRFVFY